MSLYDINSPALTFFPEPTRITPWSHRTQNVFMQLQSRGLCVASALGGLCCLCVLMTDLVFAHPPIKFQNYIYYNIYIFCIFATRIVQSLLYLNPKFQSYSHLLWLYRPVCVGPGRKHRRPVLSQRGSSITVYMVSFP